MIPNVPTWFPGSSQTRLSRSGGKGSWERGRLMYIVQSELDFRGITTTTTKLYSSTQVISTIICPPKAKVGGGTHSEKMLCRWHCGCNLISVTTIQYSKATEHARRQRGGTVVWCSPTAAILPSWTNLGLAVWVAWETGTVLSRITLWESYGMVLVKRCRKGGLHLSQ